MNFLSPSIYLVIFFYFTFITSSENWFSNYTPPFAEGIATPQLAPTAPVGTIPGEFGVNGNGGATYQIDIEVPPGTNGVQPDLSLQYNSQSQDGIVGVGWTLQGFSSIKRVGQSAMHDQAEGVVTFKVDKHSFQNTFRDLFGSSPIDPTSNDRFALDGQRLIAYRDKKGKLLTSLAERNKAYGRDGTEYRTEIDQGTRIFSFGNCGGDPCRFLVKTKDGSMAEYGYTDDSRIDASGGSKIVREWTINKSIDRNGNYTTVSYRESSDNGEWYLPDKVRYTGNDKGQLKPQRAVELIYEGRGYDTPLYIGGVKILGSNRIKEINTYVDLDGDGNNVEKPENLVKKYRLNYRQSKADKLSLLTSIRECDAKDKCLPPTTFGYGQEREADGIFNIASLGNSLGKNNATDKKTKPNLIPADFNGDGKTDFFLFEKRERSGGVECKYKIYLSNGNGTFIIGSDGVLNFQSVDIEPAIGDFDGDGRSDLFMILQSHNEEPINQQSRLYLATPNGSISDSVNKDITLKKGQSVSTVDFNRDGRADLFIPEDWEKKRSSQRDTFRIVNIYLSQNDGNYQKITQSLSLGEYSWLESSFGDYDGDGRTDLFVAAHGVVGKAPRKDDRITIYQFLDNKSTPFRRIPPLVFEGEAHYYMGDFNGDGKTDFIRQMTSNTKDPTNPFSICISKGNGEFDIKSLTNKNQVHQGFLKKVDIVTGDFNGDGKSDFLRRDEEDANDAVSFFYSWKDTFEKKRPADDAYQTNLKYNKSVSLIPGDYNGDGTTDFLKIDYSKDVDFYSDAQKIYLSKISQPNLITAITNGLGQVIEIEYKPITDNNVYTKGNDATANSLIDAQFPIWVVSKHTIIKDKLSLVPANYTYDHKYKSGKIDRDRGWLGFEETHLIDQQYKTLNITRHNLQFPFNGTIAEQKTLDLDDPRKILSDIKTNYSSLKINEFNIYRVVLNSHSILHYTEGVHNYTLRKNYIYDSAKKNITLIENLGDINITGDEIYTAFSYQHKDETSDDWWKSFFPVSKKVSSIPSNNHSNWESASLAWEKYGYDSQMNLTTSSAFRTTNGGSGSNEVKDKWITSNHTYDVFGNIIRMQDPGPKTIVTDMEYDDKFHTFPKKALSPSIRDDNGSSHRLETNFVYDPRFGIQLQEINPNKNILHTIPDLGIDGIGTILKLEGPHPSKKGTLPVYEKQLTTEANNIIVKEFTRQDWENNDISGWLWNKEYIDRLGRNFRSESAGYSDHTTLVQETNYNARGEVEKYYLPTFVGTNGSFGLFHYSEQGSKNDQFLFYQFEYDRHGRPFKTTAPDPASAMSKKLMVSKEIDYDLKNDRKIVYRVPNPDKNGQFVKWVQWTDTYGRITLKSGPYNDKEQPLPETRTTRYSYDGLGRLIEVIDPAGESTIFQYNSLGELIFESKPETGDRRYRYDDLGLLVSSIDAKKQRIEYTYDELERLVKKETFDPKDKKKRTDQYIYDSPEVSNGMGQLCKIISPSGINEFHYDKTGALTEERISLTGLDINGNGKPEQFITRYLYDPLGRLIQMTNPDQSIIQYRYRRTNGDLLKIEEKAGSGFQTLVSYSNYFASGQPGRIDYANGVSSEFSYDGTGRIHSSKTWKGAFTHQEYSYTWKQSGKINTIQDERSVRDANLSQSFSYNGAGKLSEAVVSFGTETYKYDQEGRRISDRLYNYWYDGQKGYQVRQLSNPEGKTNYTFHYDANGNMVQRDLHLILQGDLAGRVLSDSYNFDEEDRLLDVKSGVGKLLNSFTYDADGNRVSKTEADGTTTYYVNANYEVVKLPNGKFIHTRYTHGHQGIVQAKSLGSNKINLLTINDHLGKDFDKGVIFISPEDINFWFLKGLFFLMTAGFVLWSLWLLFNALNKNIFRSPDINLLSKLIASKKTLSQKWYKSIIIAFLVWSFSITSIIPIHAQQVPHKGYPSEDQVQYFHQNHLGSSTLLTDQNGGLTNAISYTPFGSSIDQQNTKGVDNFRPKFTGKEYDEKIGLYYFGSRYYDSKIGRFISPDPAAQYHDPYLYGDDDPINGVDPDGEFFWVIAFIVVGALVGAYAGGAIANHDANPAHWDWKSGKTWVGIVTGGLVGAAVGAFAAVGVAAVAGEGVVTSVGGLSAATIGSASLDAAFLTYDSYQFSQDPSVENGVWLGLDLIPFVGPLIGRSVKAARAAKGIAEVGHTAHAAELGTHDAEMAAHDAESFSHGPCPMSFAADTEIMTTEGMKPIQDVEVGDEVWGYDESKGKTCAYPVSRIFNRIAPALLLIALANDTIAVTPEHPFYLKDKGWVEASDLKAGDALFTADASLATVLSVKTVEGDNEVYNFEVEGAHNYFVSEADVLVHNPKCAPRRPAWRKGLKDELFADQEITAGKNKGKIKSDVSNQVFSRNHKITIGKNRPRPVTIWEIDHKVEFKYLYEAAKKLGASDQALKMASNHRPNLRLLTKSENASRRFGAKTPREIAKARINARGIVKHYMTLGY